MEETGSTKEIGPKGRLFQHIKNLKNIHGHDYFLWYGVCVPDITKHYIYIECDDSLTCGVWSFKDKEKEESIKIVEDAIKENNLILLDKNLNNDLNVIL